MVQVDMDSLDASRMESDCTVWMMDFHGPGYREGSRSENELDESKIYGFWS